MKKISIYTVIMYSLLNIQLTGFVFVSNEPSHNSCTKNSIQEECKTKIPNPRDFNIHKL